MSRGTKRHYTPEFKQQAADLANRIGVTRASKQLGVNESNLHRWKSKGVKRSKTNSEDPNLQEENRRLQKEVDELKKVNMILKRAAAFFSQDHLK